MGNQTVRAAIIGAGKIVQLAHIPALQAVEDVEIVAICDVRQERADEVAGEKGIANTYSDYELMLTEIQPDLTIVATPNIFHKPMTIAALQSGSHVLCEKPLALSYTDAQEMVALAQKNNLTLMVGTHLRWTDPVQACKAHVDQGFFGEIYAARTLWQRRSGIPGYGSWFTNHDLSGGGALLDIGIHAMDRALYLMGYPRPISVSGASYSKLGPQGLGLGGWGSDHFSPDSGARFDVDDLTWAFVRFENGAVIQFQVSWAAHIADQFFLELYGTEGGAFVSNHDQLTLYRTLNGQTVTMDTDMPRSSRDSYSSLVANLIGHIRGDQNATIIPLKEILTAVQIIDAIQRSAAEGREVHLNSQS